MLCTWVVKIVLYSLSKEWNLMESEVKCRKRNTRSQLQNITATEKEKSQKPMAVNGIHDFSSIPQPGCVLQCYYGKYCVISQVLTIHRRQIHIFSH